MLRMFSCLVFILTNSVMAQAALQPSDVGTLRVDPQSWVATHAGQTELDGLAVVASIEETQMDLEIPEFFANEAQTLVPLAPVKKRSFRLVLRALENPSLKAEFTLRGRNLQIDGATRFALVSDAQRDDFSFVITSQDDGSMRAEYVRKTGQESPEQGSIVLDPIPHVMRK